MTEILNARIIDTRIGESHGYLSAVIFLDGDSWGCEYGGCCGCPAGREYEKKVKPYKDANVLEYAKIFKEISNTLKEIEEYYEHIDFIIQELPREVIDIVKAKFNM